MHQKHLEYLGLTEKEAVLYSTLLKLDKSSAVSLSKKTNLKQPTVYVILDQLLKKGLVRQVQVGKRPFYEAESPEALRMLIEKEKVEMNNKIKRVENIIAELKTIDKEDGARPVVRFYEGKDAIKQSIEEYVSLEDFSGEMDYGIYSYDLLENIFSKKDIEEIEKKRIKNNTVFRAIYSGASKTISADNRNQELIKIDQERFPIECDISMFNDETRFYTTGKNSYGVVIKNKEITKTLKSIINYIFSIKK